MSLTDYQREVRRAMRTKPCSSCHQPITFLVGGLGRKIPVDAATVRDEDVRFDRARHRIHFATCRARR